MSFSPRIELAWHGRDEVCHDLHRSLQLNSQTVRSLRGIVRPVLVLPPGNAGCGPTRVWVCWTKATSQSVSAYSSRSAPSTLMQRRG